MVQGVSLLENKSLISRHGWCVITSHDKCVVCCQYCFCRSYSGLLSTSWIMLHGVKVPICIIRETGNRHAHVHCSALVLYWRIVSGPCTSQAKNAILMMIEYLIDMWYNDINYKKKIFQLKSYVSIITIIVFIIKKKVWAFTHHVILSQTKQSVYYGTTDKILVFFL